MDWAEEKYSVMTELFVRPCVSGLHFSNIQKSVIYCINNPSSLCVLVCQQKRLIQEIKMVLRVLVLYIPLPMFWALFDQQVHLICIAR